MQFEDFAFGSLRIDGRTYSIMSSLTAGRSANARKSRPRNFATSLVARPCQLGRRFPGSAADLSSPGRRQTASDERSAARGGSKSNCWCSQRSKPWRP